MEFVLIHEGDVAIEGEWDPSEQAMYIAQNPEMDPRMIFQQLKKAKVLMVTGEQGETVMSAIVHPAQALAVGFPEKDSWSA